MKNRETVTTKKAAKEFTKLAAKYTSKVTNSREKARKTLVDLGTHDKNSVIAHPGEAGALGVVSV
jgi:hypothetical protein